MKPDHDWLDEGKNHDGESCERCPRRGTVAIGRKTSAGKPPLYFSVAGNIIRR